MRRLLVVLAVALACGLVLSVPSSLAGAQTPSSTTPSTTSSTTSTIPETSSATTTTAPEVAPENVFGFLLDKKGTPDSKDDEPIVGVRIAVTKADGSDVGESTTDDKGAFEIDLPGEGAYRATIDSSTLPKGVEVTRDTIDFPVNPGQARRLNFEVNAAARETTGKVDLFLQALVDGTNFGLIIAMCAVGLSLIYGTTGLVNFAHGELVTMGAMFAFFFNRTLGWPLVLGGILAVILVGMFGWGLDAGFWGPLRRRGTGNITMMVVSIGLQLALVNLYLYQFGGLTRPYSDFHAQEAFQLGAVDIAPKKLVSTIISIVLLVLVAVLLQRTRTGKAMRAIADNPDLASSSGINVDAVIRMVWLFGAGLAAVGGVLFSVSQDVNFEEGSGLLLLLFAAITLGGLGAAYGALLGGFVIGLFVNVSTVWVPTELKNVGALAVLILVLLVRPQGILGRAERIG